MNTLVFQQQLVQQTSNYQVLQQLVGLSLKQQ